MREKTRRLLSDTSDKRIRLLLDEFSLFDDGKRRTLSAAQRKGQVKAIVANMAAWSREIQEEVRVRPYLMPAVLVAIRLSGYVEEKDKEHWALILGEEGVKKALGERVVSHDYQMFSIKNFRLFLTAPLHDCRYPIL